MFSRRRLSSAASTISLPRQPVGRRLGCEEELRAPVALDGRADQFLGMARAVKLGRVDVAHAEVDGCGDDGDLLTIPRCVGPLPPADTPGAEAVRRDSKAVGQFLEQALTGREMKGAHGCCQSQCCICGMNPCNSVLTGSWNT